MDRFIHLILLILTLQIYSCGEKPMARKLKMGETSLPSCPLTFKFSKEMYTIHDKEIHFLLNSLEKFDSEIIRKDVQIINENANKYGSFTVYKKDEKSLKIISDIYIKDLNLSATKHEIYFLDSCNIVAKMTKHAYRSKRINSIYYFSFHNGTYIGCIVLHHHSLFHKKDKWLNITNDKLALNWSERIYNNIIEQHLSTEQKIHQH
jgi:hypothetical protein